MCLMAEEILSFLDFIRELFITVKCQCIIHVSVQAPEINWVRVMESLDHEGFYIPSEDAFKFFMTIYKNACQVHFCNGEFLRKFVPLGLHDLFK